MKESGFPSRVLVEACVTSVDEAVAAERAGADRLELCVDLHVGGLTPPADLVREVKASVTIPVFVMVCVRGDDYVSTPDEVAAMERDVTAVREAGADGIVIGAVHPDGSVQREATARLITAAGPLPVTFHKAFDVTPDAREALETLVELGASRILTSGHTERAIDGADRLATLVSQAAGRLTVLLAGKVRGDHVAELVARTGASEVHARAEGVPGIVRALRG